MNDKNRDTVSIRVFILSTLIVTGLAILEYEALRWVVTKLSPNPIALLPVLIACAVFIWISYQPITDMVKRMFHEK